MDAQRSTLAIADESANFKRRFVSSLSELVSNHSIRRALSGCVVPIFFALVLHFYIQSIFLYRCDWS
jgi:hypothetical protein